MPVSFVFLTVELELIVFPRSGTETLHVNLLSKRSLHLLNLGDYYEILGLELCPPNWHFIIYVAP